MALQALRKAMKLVYPSQCLLCNESVDSDNGLCGPCWRETPIISGLCCDSCGTPLPGEDQGQVEHCDDCLTLARPWSQGRAALLYKDNARRLVLALKHGDRHDIVTLAATWMALRAAPLLQDDTIFVPVPLHWSRMIKRRFNQAALLANAVARAVNCDACPDALVRRKQTPSLDGMGADQRFLTLQSAIEPHPKRHASLTGKSVILVDDVMTSGATFSACAQSCFSAGAKDVSVLALARVTKEF